MSHVEDPNIYNLLPAVKEVRSLSFIDRDWVGSIVTWPKFNKQPVAMQILIAAVKRDPSIARFAVQLNDNPLHVSPQALIWFSFDTATGTWVKSKTAPDWVNCRMKWAC